MAEHPNIDLIKNNSGKRGKVVNVNSLRTDVLVGSNKENRPGPPSHIFREGGKGGGGDTFLVRSHP